MTTGTILDFRGESPFGDNNAPAFKEGTPSVHEKGVAYYGPWEQQADGFNEHTRRGAMALASTGCPVHLRSTRRSIVLGAPQALPERIAHLLTASISCYTARIYQLVLNASAAHNLASLETLRWHVPDDDMARINSGKVVYSVWERDHISPEFAQALSKMGQVWCACRANQKMLIRSGVPEKKVRLVPLPHSSNDPLLNLRGRERKPGAPRFYHIGKWEPRKGQDKMLEAFLLAFRPGEAHLYIKSSTLTHRVDGYTRGPNELMTDLLKHEDVRAKGWTEQEFKNHVKRFINHRLTDEEIRSLHELGDVYVSMSRGEGWDMPAYDAKLAGNLMVFSPSGGPQDFADGDDVEVLKTGSVPCHPFYGWEPESKYIDFDVRQAAEAMQYAASLVKRPLLRLQCDMGRFESRVVGKLMLSHLEQLAGGSVY